MNTPQNTSRWNSLLSQTKTCCGISFIGRARLSLVDFDAGLHGFAGCSKNLRAVLVDFAMLNQQHVQPILDLTGHATIQVLRWPHARLSSVPPSPPSLVIALAHLICLVSIRRFGNPAKRDSCMHSL